MRNTPQNEMANWRSVRQVGTFVLAVTLVLVFSLAGFGPGVVVVTALSSISGIATFRHAIETRPEVRRAANLGQRRKGIIVVLAIAFSAVVLIQVILSVVVGAWLAGLISPFALLAEWLIARELCGGVG